MRFSTIQEKIKKTNPEIRKYIKFSIFGLPSISLTIFLNIFLVEAISINKSLSYGLVNLIQVVINFSLLQKYIFNTNKYRSTFICFLKYLFGIIIFRTLDLIVYINLINYFTNLYILIQILNAVILSMIKFKYFKYIME